MPHLRKTRQPLSNVLGGAQFALCWVILLITTSGCRSSNGTPTGVLVRSKEAESAWADILAITQRADRIEIELTTQLDRHGFCRVAPLVLRDSDNINAVVSELPKCREFFKNDMQFSSGMSSEGARLVFYCTSDGAEVRLRMLGSDVIAMQADERFACNLPNRSLMTKLRSLAEKYADEHPEDVFPFPHCQ